jgi:DNA-directed RNA polymerase subunit RPC12/RpoP
MKPKVLIYDIETAPAIGLFFGKPWDVNIAKIVQHEYVFGFAYKWLAEEKIYTSYIWDFPKYGRDTKSLTGWTNNSKDVVKAWAKLVNEADILVGHNSDQFDYKQMFGRLPLYNLPPVTKPQMVDTKKAAKQIGYYPSNKLDDLGGMLGTGRKLPHSGYPNAIELWWDCMNNRLKAKKHMVAYNIIDVDRTEALYLKFRPYLTNHPNMALIADQPDVCTTCGQNYGFTSAGFKYTTTTKYRYWLCKNCRHKNRGRKSEPTRKPDYV